MHGEESAAHIARIASRAPVINVSKGITAATIKG